MEGTRATITEAKLIFPSIIINNMHRHNDFIAYLTIVILQCGILVAA